MIEVQRVIAGSNQTQLYRKKCLQQTEQQQCFTQHEAVLLSTCRATGLL